MDLPEILLNRDVSGFPLSVGTGLAMETLFTPTQESVNENPEEEKLDLSKYDLYAVNVNTIFRNILNSFKFHDVMQIHPRFIYHLLLEEITFLQGFFESNNVKLELYINSYKFFKDTYKDKLRKSSTDKQFLVDTFTDYAMKQIVKDIPNINMFSKHVAFDKKSKILLLSHIPADLLSYSRYGTFDLLESHTGQIKTRRHWNSKYFKIPGKDMSFLPFMEYLLTTFGDNVMFKPSPVKDRISLHEQLEKKGVNPLTSEMSFSFLL